MKVRSIAVFILIVGVTLAFALVPAAGASPQADRVPLAPPSSANVTDGDLDTVGATGQLLYEKPAAPFIAPPEVWVDDNYDDSTCTTAGTRGVLTALPSSRMASMPLTQAVRFM